MANSFITSPYAGKTFDGTEVFITSPIHGGKVTCHKCNDFILEGDGIAYGYYDTIEEGDEPNAWFHKKCFNRYEHYYGLDKPID